MNILEALRLSKETGVRVRPVGNSWFYFWKDGTLMIESRGGKQEVDPNFIQEEILNDDGTPCIWEIIP